LKNFSRDFFSVCGIKYKTRPGLKYHIKHTHKDGGNELIRHHTGAQDYLHEEEAVSAPSSMGAAAASLTPPSTPRMGSTFLDLSGSSFAPESVMMNAGAQSQSPYRISLLCAVAQVLLSFIILLCTLSVSFGTRTLPADAEN
jgi:hypothetical protein